MKKTVLLPFVVAGSYFTWSFYYKKHDLLSASGVTLLLFLATSLIWFSDTPAVAPSLAQAKSGIKGSASSPLGSSNLNLMNSSGRKEAIDFIVDHLKKADASIRYSSPPPTSEQRKQAYSTLTNDELKVMYLMIKFQEDSEALIAKYGTTTGDPLAKKVASEYYGIDISSLPSIEKSYVAALLKVNNSLTPKA